VPKSRGPARLVDADAVLPVGSEIVPVTHAAHLNQSRESLRSAARTLDRARGPTRSADSARALLDWKVLAEHRWSLVDHFDRDGKRYVLACRSSASFEAGALLTPRERQVVLLAVRGHSNKVIGHELGITTSTVGVLLGRARARLGVTSRRELIGAYFRPHEPEA